MKRHQKQTGARLHQVWRSLKNWLMKSSELRVWQTHDRSGKTWWHAYDPTTGCTVRELSEAEMRAWIEHRHYCTA